MVTGISMVPGTGGVAPRVAVLRAGEQRRVVPLEYHPQVEPFVAPGRLRITFRRPTGSSGKPMAIGEVRVEGLEGLASAPDLDAQTGAVCGLGPPVSVDGVLHDTEVRGTLDDVRLGRAMSWSVCDGPVRLDAGSHRVVVDPTLQFQPVTLGWEPTAAQTEAGTTPAAGSSRTVETLDWGPARRRVEIGDGDEAVLRVAENVNEGWQARLDGRELETVTLDGWQQGYRVPAGAGGTISLVYAPDTQYRVGLLLGGLLALLLLLAAVLGSALPAARARVRGAGPGPGPGRDDPGGPTA